jgi:hypothetical protein
LRGQFNWRLLCYAALVAAVAFLPFILYDFDFFEFLYILVLVPTASLILALILLALAIREKRLPSLSVLLMLPVFWLVSWALFKNSFELRSMARWTLEANNYKAKVLAQAVSPSGELRHIEWDGWGFAGEDTVSYLVFDPNDSLSTAARDHSPGKFAGIPCAVSRVRRLESHYYIVLFYTDTDWDHCS